MTVRTVILGKRLEEMTHEVCIEYQKDDQEAIVKQIPGLFRITVSVPLNPTEVGYDAMAELHFKSEEDHRIATHSEEWQRAIEDAKNFINLEESIMITVGERTTHYQSIPDHI